MSKVLVIGAGGVGSVAVHKMAMNPDIFSDITLASRTLSKCGAIADSVKQRTGVTIKKLVQTLRPLRSVTITIAGQQVTAKPRLNADAEAILAKIPDGH